MKQLFPLYFFLAFSSFSLFGQNTPPVADEVHEKLLSYQQARPTEKAYLHTDKSIYSPGETIWFKAYLTDGSTLLPGSLSTILYVELLGPDQNLISKRNIFVAEGVGKGDIALPDSLAAGSYSIRAYTRYMLNEGLPHPYTKDITIIKALPSQPATKKLPPLTSSENIEALPAQLNLHFFAEGGEVVNGLQNRIAIKAVNESGEGIDVEGNIVNNSGEVIGEFSTYKFGLGEIQLKPTPGEVPYSAIVTYNGKDYSFQLPNTKESGFGINIRSHNNRIYLNASHTNPDELEGAFVLGHIRGNTFATITGEKGAKEIYAAIPTDSLSSGIAHFTLFNKEGIPQRERLVFIDNPLHQLSLSIATDQPTYDTREEAGFQLKLQNKRGETPIGNVSATVVEESLLKKFRKNGNIRSFFLLTSDLRGKIENPDYYFNPQNKDRHYLLDLLMLTHGWRRFAWKEVLEEKLKAPSILPEKGFTVNGQLFNYSRQDKKTEGIVELRTMENFLFSKTDTTTKDGQFSFNELHFTDTVTFIVQADRIRKKDREGNDNFHIEIDSGKDLNIAPPKLSVNTVKKTINYSAYKQYQQKMAKIQEIDSVYSPDRRVILLDEVSVESERAREESVFEHSGSFYREPSGRLLMDSMPPGFSAMNVFDIIQGRVPGVFVTTNGAGRTAVIRGPGSFRAGANDALFLLDGMPVEPQVMNTIFGHDIAYIDVVKGAKTAAFGSRGSNGIIAVYTKRGVGQQPINEDVPGIITFKYPGYYLAREFYTPNYHKDDPSHAKPDFRSTLYWNPDIFIDENGEAEIKFFTSDEKEEYILLIEGITADGRFITGEKTFSVE
ncbi:TonB-dependent receptor plug domain-containing protein [Nafulsella turpanensis]|uniref:TonB-dependent receptor plug domain-containing protein n=1 Tax=Nafulsella turpanensis TaxID=1265690 RepID=UPI00034B069E|nr:TonB-dependent receptor plug domain-containing protein [Nafulsella turpanensis]